MTRAERLQVASLVHELVALDELEAATRRRGRRLKDLDQLLFVFAAAKEQKLALIRMRLGLGDPRG